MYIVTSPTSDGSCSKICETWDDVKTYVQNTSEDYAIHPNDFRIFEAKEINFITRFVLEVSPS